MTSTANRSAPLWMTRTLQIAAIYNLAWGAVVIVAPLLLFRWAGMEMPRYPQIWQCVGMIVGVYGLGYWWAAADPYRHWPIVLVGFLGKILGPIGFVQAAVAGDLPWKWGATILTNDLIWWLPFGLILYQAFRWNTDTSVGSATVSLEEGMTDLVGGGVSLRDASFQSPTLVVFLRHAGCTFCREALSDLKRLRGEIEKTGTKIAIVHMGSEQDGAELVQRHGLPGVTHFSDPHCVAYRAFQVGRGSFSQVFSAHIVVRAWQALLRGHGVGKLHGDGFRMPGAFVVFEGRILAGKALEGVADVPDYVGLATSAEAKLIAT